MTLRRWLLLAAVAVAVTLIIWRTASPPAVEVASVSRGDLVDTLSATGVVEAAQTTVAPKVVGRIEAILVDEGEPVGQGQVLARLDATDLRAALAQTEAERASAGADVARLATALAQEERASPARIARAQAVQAAARARLDEVKAGSRPQNIEGAREAVAVARTERDLALSDLARLRRLFDAGAVAEADLDAARARQQAAEARLRAAQERLDLLEEGARGEQIAAAQAEWEASQAALAEAQAAAGQVEVLAHSLEAAKARASAASAAVEVGRSTLAEAEITAPISGHVGRRYLDVGDLTGPSAPVFLISDGEDLWVTAEVDEEDVHLVHKGQQVEVNAESLAAPLTGTVAEVGAVAVPRGLQQVRAKIVRCKVLLTEGAGLLRAGMEVDVSAQTELASQVLVIPAEAVIDSQDESFVLVVSGGVVARRRIEAGLRTFREVEVQSGLKEGEEVIVGAAPELREGSRVRAARD